MVAESRPEPVLRKYSPATGELLAELKCNSAAEVAAMVARARTAQAAWARLTVRARGQALVRCSQVVADRAQELAELIASETGKPVVEALLHEVMPIANLARYFGTRAHRILAPRTIKLTLLKHRKSYVHYVPRGVIGVISPWNFPFSIGSGDVLMALAAGNAVVHKGSEWTPRMALELPKILAQAGLDPDLLQTPVGYGDVGQAVIESGVDMVHFTGSVPTGRKIGALCGERLIPCVLELGGKDAALVLDDADAEHAARMIVWGAFANAGQVCASVERVYATPGIYDTLVQRLIAHTQGLRQGDGLKDDVDVGPMIMPRQLEIVRRHVDAAVAQGATVRVGGQSHGTYFAPTVLTDVRDDMAVCKDETFGPVLPVVKVRDVDEAIARANASEYGLSAYVFTRNVQRGLEVAERLRAGTVAVNDVLMTHAAPETPWGGVKSSGIGITHSDDGLRQMCEQRHVNYSHLPAFLPPWIYPYERGMAAAVVQVVRGLFGSGSLPVRAMRLVRGFTAVLFKYRKR